MGLFRSRKKQTESFPVSVGGSGFNDMAFSGNQKALENSAFWCCVMNLCRTFATLPIHQYTSKDGARSVLRKGATARLLTKPCPYMTSYQWRFVMAFNFEMHGVAYAILERSSVGDVIAMYPVSPNVITPAWVQGKLKYRVHSSRDLLDPANVLVMSNTQVGFTTILSPVEYAKKDLQVGGSAKVLQTNYYKRGTTIGGVVTVPKGTNKEVKDQIRSMFANEFAGEHNSYKVAVLEDMIKYEPIRLTENDSKKLNEAEGWTLLEVCRRFGVPPFFAGDLTKATYANSEQQGTQLVQYSIQPRATSWESAFNEVLCKDGQYIKFSLGGLMRGDHASRSAFYHNAILDGWMTVNELRAPEDLNPVREGDVLMFPMNYTSLATAIDSRPYSGHQEQQEKHSEPAPLTEKRRQGISFLSEVQAVTRSSRSKIEKIIRQQLKAEIRELKRLVATNQGQGIQKILDNFATFCDKLAGEYGQKYVPVFQGIINRLAPIVQKQVKTGADISDEASGSYAAKYAVSMAGRHGKSRVSDVKLALAGKPETEAEDVIGDITQKWISDVPVEESKEETMRSGNAFNVFLFATLGVTYMHVVANADACDFCSKLDGQVVEVNGTILDKGASVDDGAGNVRVINKSMKHPPFHRGCECGVAPGK